MGLPPLEGGTTISVRFDTTEPRKYLEFVIIVIHTFGFWCGLLDDSREMSGCVVELGGGGGVGFGQV